MKIKKFNQILENSDFDTSEEVLWVFYGKYSTYYEKIETCYSLDECIEWYDSTTRDDTSRFFIGSKIYTKIVLVEETINSKILDINDIVAAKKYNL